MPVKVEKKLSRAKEVEKILQELQSNKEAKIGWISGNKHPGSKLTIAKVAAQNEIGFPDLKIPPRPFMRPAMKENRDELVRNIAGLSAIVFRGEKPTSVILEMIVLYMKGKVKEAIKKVDAPALKESTIKNRISKYKDKKRTFTIEKPLVASGLMLNTVTGIVE